MTPSSETQLLANARDGDQTAFESLVAPLRRPLYAYIYRMATHAQDAEDLMQDTLVRVLEGLPTFRRESQFKTWLFGIATHVCLDHLRKKKRWRVEAQLEGEREAKGEGSEVSRSMTAIAARPEFRFEIREHIAFCFTCVARTLDPEQQAALMLREALGFSNEEAAEITGVSEPVLRHRLSSARTTMSGHFDGLCQLVNKTGLCYQCRGLREWVPEARRGADLVRIEVAPGMAVTPESLLEARVAIVRDADLEGGTTRAMHDLFYEGIAAREENRTHTD